MGLDIAIFGLVAGFCRRDAGAREEQGVANQGDQSARDHRKEQRRRGDEVVEQGKQHDFADAGAGGGARGNQTDHPGDNVGAADESPVDRGRAGRGREVETERDEHCSCHAQERDVTREGDSARTIDKEAQQQQRAADHGTADADARRR